MCSHFLSIASSANYLSNIHAPLLPNRIPIMLGRTVFTHKILAFPTLPYKKRCGQWDIKYHWMNFKGKKSLNGVYLDCSCPFALPYNFFFFLELKYDGWSSSSHLIIMKWSLRPKDGRTTMEKKFGSLNQSWETYLWISCHLKIKIKPFVV